MAGMNLSRAFNAMMLSKLTRYQEKAGSYDDNNVYIDGITTVTTFVGVIKTGNKFSRFTEGIALQAMSGGERYSDYKSLYVTDKNLVFVGDKVGWNSKFYDVIQMSDETPFNFRGFILEELKNWVPT